MITTLKVVAGAVIGVLLGGAIGFGLAWLLYAGVDTSKAPAGQQDSAAMGIGFAIMGLTFLGAGIGFTGGVILALFLPRRKKPLPEQQP